MKQATCRELRGACDEIITGETLEEMGEHSKQHVMRMVQAGDEAHKNAMNDMMMLSKEDQEQWYEEFKSSFDSLDDAS
jgi:hypothetical protein